MKTKQMKVLYASRSSSKRYIGGNTYTCTPKISMEGKWLEELGFHIGDAIQVFYEDNCIRLPPWYAKNRHSTKQSRIDAKEEITFRTESSLLISHFKHPTLFTCSRSKILQKQNNIQMKSPGVSQGFSLSVFVFLITLFRHRLSIMAILTQRLPVGLSPEQFFLSTVRNNMIHNGGFHQLPTFPAPDTQRVFFQIPAPGFPPASVITSL